MRRSKPLIRRSKHGHALDRASRCVPGNIVFMRTTVVIDSDVAAEIERLRREGLGVSEALNLLARRGMAKESAQRANYQHRTAKIGLKVDVTNVADVLDLLDDR
jgi:hypothetical protein